MNIYTFSFIFRNLYYYILLNILVQSFFLTFFLLDFSKPNICESSIVSAFVICPYIVKFLLEILQPLFFEEIHNYK